MTTQTLILGHLQPTDYVPPRGDCKQCGGQCDGPDCGLHAAGCVYGGFGYGYWMYAEDCPLDHGPTSCVVDICCQ